ncbi:MAG: hypothetical protein HYY52_06670 [Candidatus Melainabacteria bacterium]|nr:hypothetical protein [Candidatus Melainabacteria bacterium]
MSNNTFAQGDGDKELEAALREDEDLSSVQPTQEGTHVQRSIAASVLGRELTQREKDSLGNDYTKHDVEIAFLANEQRLVIVRALLACGVPEENIKEILIIYQVSKLQTFKELVDYFTDLKERHGSVIDGIRDEFILNIKDYEQTFKKAAVRAYEIVFCIKLEVENDIQQVVGFLKEQEALTFSKMVEVLMSALTPKQKEEMLFKALDKVGRSDLKENKEFTEKILAQEFTCENLSRMLQELGPAKKSQPIKQPPEKPSGKKPQKK